MLDSAASIKRKNDKSLKRLDEIFAMINRYSDKKFTGSVQIYIHFCQGGITDAYKVEKVKVLL